ncbi:hypothetical protein ASZ90_010772 [hydrocarbon metagenome]|uniref:Uncharacterized protein n=1 Tax=hydrocarbon metagenome TaxID=938273 RepID=A0A0W8FFF7_9ZZZZ
MRVPISRTMPFLCPIVSAAVPAVFYKGRRDFAASEESRAPPGIPGACRQSHPCRGARFEEACRRV